MRRLEPGFDEAKLGFKRFSDFLKAAANTDAALKLSMDDKLTDYVLIPRSQPGKPKTAQKPEEARATDRSPDAAVKRIARPTYGADQGKVATLVCPILAEGPMQRSHLAQALKKRHFADDTDVSVSGLYLLIGKLIQSGALCAQLSDRRSIVSLPGSQQASDSRGPRMQPVIST